MRVAWSPPDDTGGGAAAAHPLMGYEVTLVQLGETEAVVLTRSEAPGTRQSEFTGLVRGTAYQVQVRAQNDALDDSGYGPAAVAAGQCADGVSRAGVCDAAGLVASGAASAPTGLELRVAGSGVIGVSFGVPGDTGDGTSTFPVLGYELEWEGRALGSGTVSAGGTVELGSGELEWQTPGSLQSGMRVSVRVRARNVAGDGAWSLQLAKAAVIYPDAPIFVTAGSGSIETCPVSTEGGTRRVQLVREGGGRAGCSGSIPSLYLALYWTVPENTGSGSADASLLTALTVEISGTASFDAVTSVVLPIIANDASQTAHLGAEQSVLLDLGRTYFLRGWVTNAVGRSGLSQVVSRQAAGLSSAPLGAELRTMGELALRAVWEPPLDLGAGDGVSYPLLGYEVSFLELDTTTGTWTSVETRDLGAQDHAADFSGLQKGVMYQVRGVYPSFPLESEP